MAECSGRMIAVYDEREKSSIPDACRAEIRVGEQTTEKSGKEINDTKLAKETLQEALKAEKPREGLILHSDQGSQFTLWEFVTYCKEER